MDDTINSILRGCRLARDLEHNLPNLANQPNLLAVSCEQIIQVFSVIRERLRHNPLDAGSGRYREMQEMRRSEVQAGSGSSNLEEWLKSSGYAQSILQQTQCWAGTSGARTGNTEGPMEAMGAVAMGEGPFVRLGGGGEEMQAPDVSSDRRRSASSSSERTRRRNSDAEKRTIRVPAPRMGNTEIPPEDGYTWRKYGQKEILGSKFPRGYYRCTHQKLYHCPAKKQVQRLDNDPFTFEVMYRGDHTCHMSSTAPSIPPPPPASLDMAPIAATQPISASVSAPLPRWLPVDFGMGGASGSRNMAVGGSVAGSEAGPSTSGSRRGKEAEYPLVADLADAMFNSGSSSTNSMDFIFPSSTEDKREEDDKKIDD
ncbi:LOW QUALITY PROTEIN: WRKY transcription factor 55 [Eucalyptus grandis]|uniref:LOW QUALITY PROTEIN: WRKY transcription factor 55 n=1 Tax=Eucalyptus grandis TaxID=71139 RepID=UPI00192EFF09|nr:LOW QUALITY PROTEIN: WRKY transcription factor 55 [Eucalyptus grandis]